MRVHAIRCWAIALMLGALLMVVLFPGQEDPGPNKPGEGEKPTQAKPHAYKDATFAAFKKLLVTPDWKPADPPRNPQGMLEAVHVKTGLTFVLIPAGEFLMGSPGSEAGRRENEGPVHRVRVAAFLLCRTECTQRAWENGGAVNESYCKGPDRPVDRVNWEHVSSWCDKTGLRPPSEAEWEYSCRAGTTTAYSWGEVWDPSKCMTENSAGLHKSRGREHYMRMGLSVNATAQVGSFPPNPWGLLDMHGNVLEWCGDNYHKSYEGAPVDSRPRRADCGPERVGRGGSYIGKARSCRSASRAQMAVPGYPLRVSGFRPAAGLPK